MQNFEELYEGLPKEQAITWRREAIDKWGEDAVLRSEKALMEMTPANLERLKADQEDIRQQLRALAGEEPASDAVQKQVARHYANIRGFWGVNDPTDLRAATYKGLAELYVTDERYTATDGKPDTAFVRFMRDAMVYFAETMLKG